MPKVDLRPLAEMFSKTEICWSRSCTYPRGLGPPCWRCCKRRGESTMRLSRWSWPGGI